MATASTPSSSECGLGATADCWAACKFLFHPRYHSPTGMRVLNDAFMKQSKGTKHPGTVELNMDESSTFDVKLYQD